MIRILACRLSISLLMNSFRQRKKKYNTISSLPLSFSLPFPLSLYFFYSSHHLTIPLFPPHISFFFSLSLIFSFPPCYSTCPSNCLILSLLFYGVILLIPIPSTSHPYLVTHKRLACNSSDIHISQQTTCFCNVRVTSASSCRECGFTHARTLACTAQG